jgi:hypothetical protein
MVFTHGGRLAALPQFVAELALLLGIFGVARRLGFGRPEAAFAALLFATLSEVVLEATTAQNDLVLAAPVLACAFFLLGRSRSEQLLGAVALGVALGTKFTAVYALPLLGLLALSVLPRRRLLEFVGAAAAALALLGSAVYVQNVIHYGTPLGSSADRAEFTPKITAANTVSTTARTLYRFADLSGFAGGFQTYKTQEAVGKFVFAKLDIDPRPASATLSHQQFLFTFNTDANEDVSYFGPLGFVLLLPLAFGYLGAFARRRTSRVKAIFALALPAVAVEVALTYRYDDWLGRFMILPVAFGAVLVARTYSQRLPSAIFAAIGIVFLFFALAHNERKPIGLDGTRAAWSLPRDAAEGLVAPGGTQAFQALDTLVPAHATVGLVFGDDDWDYPLYGPHLTRHLVVLPAKDPFRTARSLHLDWVVVGDVDVSVAPRWQQAQVGQWRLLAPAGTPEAKRLAAYASASGAL